MATSRTRRVAIACQGGGSHTAFTAGVLERIIRDRPSEYEITALSGTSGGAICAMLAWQGLRADDPQDAVDALEGFWTDLSTQTLWERAFNTGLLFTNRLIDEFGSVAVSPYYNPSSELGRRYLLSLLERHIDLERAIAAGGTPELFVSAVDVLSGEFTIFENGEGGLEAVMASATIPNLYEATAVEGRYYWDGLFSQNPPIRHFTAADDPARKPDEIWLVQINPRTIAELPTSMAEIQDRRNELAGNLSLGQERHTIEVINRLVAEGVITDERYKQIDIVEVTLDWDLDYHSKLDRDPSLVTDLYEYGTRRGEEFWTRERV